MRKVFIFIFVVVALSFHGMVMACMIVGGPPEKMVSELFQESQIILRGQVLYIDDRNIEVSHFDRMAKIEITELIKTPKKTTNKDDLKTSPGTVDVLYKFVGNTRSKYCDNGGGTHFETGKNYFVFAQRDSASNLFATHTSGKHALLDYVFDEAQIMDFINKGQDSQLKTQFCFPTFSDHYESEIFAKPVPKQAPCVTDLRNLYRTERSYSQTP